MKKYGYKNISDRNGFEEASKRDTQIPNNPVDTKNLTNYDFIDWSTKGNFGMPGQTRYFVKEINDLIKAGDKVSAPVMKERDPKGYVGW